MAHLAQNPAVARYDAFDGVRRAVGVVGRLGRHAAFGIDVLEGHLPVGEKLLGQLLADDELALSVADGDRVHLAQFEARATES